MAHQYFFFNKNRTADCSPACVYLFLAWRVFGTTSALSRGGEKNESSSKNTMYHAKIYSSYEKIMQQINLLR